MSEQLKNVHYYPGHMKKAQDSLANFIKSCDLIVEIADARAPESTRNPALKQMIGNKPHLIVLSKSDTSDPATLNLWINYYRNQGTICFAADLKSVKVFNILRAQAQPLIEKKREKEAKLGMKKQPIRLLIMGIPNVGKSTFINNLAGKNVVKAANTPGVTRAQQWIKLPNDFVLLDTPGILPMNYPDGSQAVRLALLGSIKESVLPNEELSIALIGYLREEYPFSLKERFGIEDLRELTSDEILIKIAEKRGFLLQGGSPDISKSAISLIRDLQDGNLGGICLEKPRC
ncbi:MAG: ribosome biogenesis GTPase YlqF [Bacilli bacterium]|nr:ribosome biogenesis GTPase YlqF [Bacilli bacterium]